jgi:hypothetical protein
MVDFVLLRTGRASQITIAQARAFHWLMKL